MNPTDLGQIDEINFNLDGMKICEKYPNENKCPLCPEKDEQIAMLAQVNDTLFKKLEKSVACEKCIEIRKLKENGNNSKSKYALNGGLNGGNDRIVGGQFNPIQMSTPKNAMKKKPIHPIQTSTPKNGMEKKSVHPIQTSSPKNVMEKNLTENATPNQRSTSGFSSMFSLNSPMNFLPNWLSFLNQSDPPMSEKQNDVEESENWNLDPPMSPIILEASKNIEENKGKATTKEFGQEKVAPSNSNFRQRSPPTIIQSEEQLPKSTMEKGGGKLAIAFRNGAGRKGRKLLIRDITETTIGKIEVEQTFKTEESETNNDGGEENEEREEEDQNKEEDDDVNVNEEERREVGQEEVNMAPATPNPDTYCRFCQAQFDTPRGLKIHKSGKAHGRRVAEMNGDDDQIPCTYEGCESRLSSAKSLKDHISRMHKPKFVCEECGKGYATQSWLNKHQQKEGHYA